MLFTNPFGLLRGDARAQESTNPVVAENRKPGTDRPWRDFEAFTAPGVAPTGGRVADDINGQIKGYASATSVNKGGSITFRITVKPAQAYTIDIYRVGWYGGSGFRLLKRIGRRAGIRQPPCLSREYAVTGLIECKWSPGYILTVPSTWTSGVYLARLTNERSYWSYVPFVVRDDARRSDLLLAQSVTTYQAYNNYPNDGQTGKALYSTRSYGANTMSDTKRAVKVSFDRPYTGMGAGVFWTKEYVFIGWLERNGYDVSYATNVDTHDRPSMLLRHKGFLSVGHDEYWSKRMYDGAEVARDSGVDLAFFGANDVYWQVRFAPSSREVSNRVMVCYKYKQPDDARIPLDPVRGPTTTVRWRDPLLNRPEQTLIGVQYTAEPKQESPYVVRNSDHWVYEGTGLKYGWTIPRIVAAETDRDMGKYPAPRHRPGTWRLLSRSPLIHRTGDRPDYQQTSIYQAPSGAWVFGAGTLGWSFGLGREGYTDWRVQRMTANILNRFVGGRPPLATSPSIEARSRLMAGRRRGSYQACWSGGTTPARRIPRQKC